VKVHHGWSGEVAPNKWVKFYVALDEDDFRRMLTRSGIRASDDVRWGIQLTAVYQLLELEAERLVLYKLITRYGYDPAEGRAKIADLGRQIDERLAAIKAGVKAAGR